MTNGQLLRPRLTSWRTLACRDQARPRLRGDGRAVSPALQAHLAPFFKTVGNVTTATVKTYSRKRMEHVIRATVQKEAVHFAGSPEVAGRAELR